MANIKFLNCAPVPLEMHKARYIQKLTLLPIDERAEKNQAAGNNAHLLRNEDVFLDMLTDSGVNAMSDKQLAAMMQADDAYAGSASFYKLEEAIKEIFDLPFFLPAHQGRACEHLLSRVFIKQGNIVPMNYHFTTTRAHIEKAKGEVLELLYEEGTEPQSDRPFKGDMNTEKLRELLDGEEISNIAFVRIEAGTNLIGGQPVSLGNIREVSRLCRAKGIKTILDASLLADNLYFIKMREEGCQDISVKELILQISDCFDIIYFSARKLTCSRGGGICFKKEEDYKKILELIPLYEGFSTYGGISVKEIEAMAVGLKETLDDDFISQGPIFIEQMTKMLIANGVPMVTPPGGLGVHIDCRRFLPHVAPSSYPGGALAAALYIASGIRGTERGTLSEERDEDGDEVFAKMELLRLALPRRVFTLSHITYAVDRITWLYNNRELIGGLKFTEEPKLMRFFFGRLAPDGEWQERLIEKFKKDFGDSL